MHISASSEAMQHFSAGQPAGRNGLLRKVLKFVLLPIAVLLAGRSIGNEILRAWIVVLGSYTVLITAVGLVGQTQHERPEMIQRTVRLLGSMVWEGFVVLAYFFVYNIITMC